MVEGYRRGRRKQKLLGNHQKCWVWGRNAVLETLRAGRWPPHEVRLSDSLSAAELQAAQALAERRNLSVLVETHEELTKRCRSGEHQGYLARMPPFPYDNTGDVLSAGTAPPLFLVLDSIQDPYNFGAIVRSADVMGVDGLFIREKGQVGITSLVARTSAGAVNHVRIARVEDLAGLVGTLKERQVRIAAAVRDDAIPCCDYDWTQPTALLIGNEGAGIEPTLLESADERVTIPQFGSVDSLNAAVATGVLLYEARRQRGDGPKTPLPPGEGQLQRRSL